MKLTTKIIEGLIILGVGFLGGHFLMPEKTVEVPVDVEVEKIVEKKIYIQGKTIEVEKIVEVLGDDSAELIALRTDKVDGFIDVLENKIDIFEGKIEYINDDIDVLQDKIDTKYDQITLLQAQINAKEILIDALFVDDPVGNLADIRVLEDEIIVLENQIDNKQNKIDGWLDDIADLNEDKEPWQDKIDLDTTCITEINAYITNGSEYSEDVEDRLEVLNLI